MTLVVSGIMAIAHLYLGWRLTKAAGFLTPKKLPRWIPVLFMLSFYTLPVAGFTTFANNGSVNILEIPKPITYWFWFGLAFSYQFISWVIVSDLVKLGFLFRSSVEKNRINMIYGRFIMTLSVVMLFFTGFKMYNDTTRVEVQEAELAVEGLPASLEGLRIAHISDIQGDQYTGSEQIARYIEVLNARHPDLIIFTGDLISYGTDYIEMAAEEFSESDAGMGTYAIVGDHDYWAGLENVEPALESRGIELLQNENIHLVAETDSLLITGITEVYSRSVEPERVRQLIASSDGSALKILASHQLSDLLLREAEAGGYQLLLGGHTHGGQIRLPLFGMTFSASDLETEFVGGVYRRGDLLINVNNGLGFTLAPVRYNAPPAISIITLTGSPE